MKMDRREFVKMSAMAAATAVAGLRAGAAAPAQSRRPPGLTA